MKIFHKFMARINEGLTLISYLYLKKNIEFMNVNVCVVCHPITCELNIKSIISCLKDIHPL